ncbi:thioredoxin-like [Tiliqua scincoides]|uniref:thioredoxin-like n=1 Tax=Tiliqua scincoides TaxID=71010 RepID=UPI0034637047
MCSMGAAGEAGQPYWSFPKSATTTAAVNEQNLTTQMLQALLSLRSFQAQAEPRRALKNSVLSGTGGGEETLVAAKEFTDFLKNAGPNLVVVDFTAKWCGPCKMMRPFVYEMAVRYGNVLFCIVDVDVAEDVANNCNIVAMPTFQLFKKGEKIFEMTGANAKKLESKIKELM